MRTNRLLATAGTLTIAFCSALPAYAAGTAAGSNIVNSVTVNYQVGGVPQTQITASNTFVVDRRITLTVTEVGTTATIVVPGQTAAATTFLVTNTSNAPLDFGLAIAQQTGGAAAHGGTDTFDVTTPSLFIDTNNSGDYTPGTDQAITFLDEIAADASRTVFIVANVPTGRVNTDVAAVTLTAQAREAGGAGAQGLVVAQTAGANTAGMDTVFADGTSGIAGDAARDGQYSAKDDYAVSAATLTVAKLSRVISDPFNGTTNPKMIPGAVVEYCITVANASGSAAASNVVISDPVPAATTYETAFGVFVNGTVASGVCSGGTATGSYDGPTRTVSGTLASVPGGATQTLYFQTKIN